MAVGGDQMTIADEPATEDMCNAFGELQSERESNNATGILLPPVPASNFFVGIDNMAIKIKHHIIRDFFIAKYYYLMIL